MFLVWVLRIQDCGRASGPFATPALRRSASPGDPALHDVITKSSARVIASFGLRQ